MTAAAYLAELIRRGELRPETVEMLGRRFPDATAPEMEIFLADSRLVGPAEYDRPGHGPRARLLGASAVRPAPPARPAPDLAAIAAAEARRRASDRARAEEAEDVASVAAYCRPMK